MTRTLIYFQLSFSFFLTRRQSRFVGIKQYTTREVMLGKYNMWSCPRMYPVLLCGCVWRCSGKGRGSDGKGRG